MPTEKVPTKLVVQTLNIENYNNHKAKVDFFVELGEFDASSAGSFTVVPTWAIGEKQGSDQLVVTIQRLKDRPIMFLASQDLITTTIDENHTLRISSSNDLIAPPPSVLYIAI